MATRSLDTSGSLFFMSRAGRWLKLISSKRKDAWLDLYIHHKNIYTQGKSEVGFAYDFIQLQSFMLGWLFLRDIWPGIPAWTLGAVYPVLLVVKVGLYYSLGRWWDRRRMFDRQHTWENRRNPVMKTLSRKVLDGEGIEEA